MWQLARVLGEIALRRRGPDSLPDSSFLLGMLVVLYVMVSALDFLIYDAFNFRTLTHLTAQMVLLLGYVFAVLAFFKLDRRYRQTLSAILGANIIIYCIYFPIAIAAILLEFDLQTNPMVALRFAFWFWSIFIEAFIFARALSQPMLLGFMFEILYVLPSLSISEYFAQTVE